MNILGITIMRTKRYLAMKARLKNYLSRRQEEHDQHDALWSLHLEVRKRCALLCKQLDAANAEIARLREIKAKYADLLIAHEALKAEHTRWTDRGPDGRFVGDTK